MVDRPRRCAFASADREIDSGLCVEASALPAFDDLDRVLEPADRCRIAGCIDEFDRGIDLGSH